MLSEESNTHERTGYSLRASVHKSRKNTIQMTQLKDQTERDIRTNCEQNKSIQNKPNI